MTKRWGKPYKDNRDWKKYNEELVIRGKFLFDLNFSDQWNEELKEMNNGKRGAPFKFPRSFMMVWHQFIDYRGLEVLARALTKMGIIPYYGEYTTVWKRIHKIKPNLKIKGLEYAELWSDGTGLKTSNGGTYRIMKYGDPDAEKKKYLVVIITADVRTKKIIGIESHIEGSGKSEPEAAKEQIKVAVSEGVKVKKFYGDGAFDTNQMFELLHLLGAKSVIKIRKNAAPENIRSSKWRRKEAREYKKQGYRPWADENGYGMRWPGTEGIFSAVKRKYGENLVSRSIEGLVAEGYQRFWIYDYINQRAKKEVMEVK